MDKHKRPKITSGRTYKVTTGCGSIYITPCYDGDTLIEVFATLGKAGGCAHCQLEAITRSISLGLKYRIPADEYIRQLRGIRCPSAALDSGKEILSCPDAIVKVLGGEFDSESSNDNPSKVS